MTPRNIKIATLILASPLILGTTGFFLPLIDQALRDYLGTHSGRLINTYAVVLYGLFVGSYWGFIAIKEPQNFTPYLLVLTPAISILLIYSVGSSYRSFALMIYLLLLIPIDWFFKKQMLAPAWWMGFKIPLTGFVILCLFTPRFINFILATLALT